MTRKLGRLALILAATGAAATPASAQTTTPAKPVPCDGVLSVTDPAGDAFVGFAGTSSPVAAEANQDITGLFFRTEGTKVFAHLAVKDLQTAVPPGALGVVYRMIWTDETDVRRFLDVSFYGEAYQALGIPAEGASYGSFGQAGPESEGDVPLQLFKGTDGVIRVQMPPSVKVGKFLSGLTWNAATDRGLVIAQSDITETVDYNGKACPKPAA